MNSGYCIKCNRPIKGHPLPNGLRCKVSQTTSDMSNESVHTNPESTKTNPEHANCSLRSSKCQRQLKSHPKLMGKCKMDLLSEGFRWKMDLAQKRRSIQQRLHWVGTKNRKYQNQWKSHISQGKTLPAYKTMHTDEKRHICRLCGIAFDMVANFIHHVSVHHNGISHKCTLCDVSFKKFRRLQLHMEIKHNHIPKQNKLQNKMKSVMSTDESGEKKQPYSCSVCHNAFSQRWKVTTHMIAVHTNGGLYECGLCDKTFVFPSQLESHMGEHEGERPYVCGLCDKEFMISANLESHMKLHIEDQLEEDTWEN